MSGEQCKRCRFWVEEMSARDPDDEGFGFGLCCREPPRVSETFVAALMPRLEYGQQTDPEIGTVQMTSASLFPATCSTDWCGAYGPIPAADRHPSWVEEYERTRVAIDDLTTREETPAYEALRQRMSQLEEAVVATPAITKEDVIAKLFMITRINGDGATPDNKHVARTVEEAHSLLGLQSSEP